MAQSPTEPLKPYWHIETLQKTDELHVILLTSKKRLHTGERRIATWVWDETRFRLSPPMGMSTVETMAAEARRDINYGVPLTKIRHMIRVYAREMMPKRFKRHRARMEKLRENRQMQRHSNFGMF